MVFGLFRSKRRIDVASSVYSLAGEEEKIPDYLKTVVANQNIAKRFSTMAEALSSSFLSGPGIKMASFYRWSQRRYAHFGMRGARVTGTSFIDPSTLVQHLPIPDLQESDIQTAEAGFGDHVWWARRWILEHHIDRFIEDWTADMPNGPLGSIRVTFENGDTLLVPKNEFRGSTLFLYVTYYDRVKQEPAIFIYAYGTGNAALDAMMTFVEMASDYYPVLPLRIDNRFVSEDSRRQFYAYAKRGLKRLGNINLDELLIKLNENQSIGDIDYAFVVPGVSLNTKKNVGREYIYRFFQTVPNTNFQEYQDWIASQNQASQMQNVWDQWAIEREGLEPALAGFAAAPSRILTLTAPGMDYQVSIEWGNIVETTGEGLGRPGAQAGDLWWNDAELQTWSWGIRGKKVKDMKAEASRANVELCWQDTPNSWRKLSLRGLVHRNNVYRNNYVEITAAEALTDDELSGFVLPLRDDIVQQLSLRERTDLQAMSLLLVLNSYKITKVKWYQRGFFKVLLVVAIIATIAFTGGFSATGVGVLGTNLAVGSAIGLAGTAAIIAGVVANAVAAVIITSIITAGATAVFGDKIGQIVGVVASFIALSAVSSFATTGKFAINFSQLAKVDNIIQMTSSVGNAVAKSIQADTLRLLEETENMMGEYTDKMSEISKAFAQNVGYGNGVIDPLQFLQANAPVEETPEGFLQRTLMTGSDIAALTMQMVSNFTDISLDLNKMA